MDEFDEGIWQYEKQRARSTMMGGVVAMILGLVVAGGAIAASVWTWTYFEHVEVRVVTGIGGVGLTAVIAGIGMLLSARSRMARLKREKRAESFRVPTDR